MSMFGLLAQQIRVRPAAFLASAGSWALFNMIVLVPGLIIQRVFDGVDGGAPTWSVISLVALFVAVTVARATATIPAVYWQVTYEYGLASKLRHDLMTRLVRRPVTRVSNGSPAGIVNTMRDDVNAVVRAPIALMDTVTSGIVTLVALVVLAGTNLMATLVVVIPLMIVFAVVRALANRVTRYRQVGRAATEEVTSFLTSAVTATQSVQVYGAGERVVAHLRELNRRRQHALVRDETVSAVVPAVTIQISTVGAGLVLLVTAPLLLSGSFTVGDLALFDAYLFHCIQFAAGLAGFLTTWRQAKVSLARLGNVTDTPVADLMIIPPEDDTPPLPALRTMRARGLSIEDGSSDGVDLVMEPGSVVVVVGPVGAGKSTLVRALTTSVIADGGTVTWNGRPIADDGALAPPRMGVVTQDPIALATTIRTNIDLGRQLPSVVVTQALEAAGLESEVDAMPHGLDTVVGSGGQTLSGGQLQRLAIARMLAGQCDLYTLDDATSALDLPTERRLWERLLPGTSAAWLIATQRPEVLRYATRILIVGGGRVVAQGTGAEMRENPTVREMRAEPVSALAPPADE